MLVAPWFSILSFLNNTVVTPGECTGDYFTMDDFQHHKVAKLIGYDSTIHVNLTLKAKYFYHTLCKAFMSQF